MICIATFYSHFGAIRFKKQCEKNGSKATLMPVPRYLSSSCGTCVRYESTAYCPMETIPEEVEQIIEINQKSEDGTYILHYRAENS